MKAFIFSLLLLLSPAIAEAVDRYVQPSASGLCSQSNTLYNPASNTCGSGTSTVYIASSQGNLNIALAATNAGDRLLFRAGTYNWKIDSNLFAMHSGTSFTNAVTFAAFSGETVTFTSNDGNTIVNIATGGATATVAYVIIDGLQFNGAAINSPSNAQSTVSLSYSGTSPLPHHIRFINGRVYNNGANFAPNACCSGAGFNIHADDSEFINMEIDHNSENALSTGASNAPYGLYMNTGSRNLIERSAIHHNGAFGIHGYSDARTSVNNNIYRYNTIYSNGAILHAGSGILISSGSGNAAYNNIVYSNDVGIRVDYDCANCLVYNNTVYSNANYGLELHNTGATPIITNNIFSTNPSGNIQNDGGSSPSYSNNLCSTSVTGCDPALTEASASTTFVTPGVDFTLKAGSKAIDGGTATVAPSITIPVCSGGITSGCYNGTAPDIGALEGGAPSPAGPPALTATPSTVAANASIALTVNEDTVNQRVETVGDWVAMFVPGASASTPAIDWFYMNGTKTAPAAAISNATISFIAPSTPGSYEFRFYANNSTAETDRLATAPFTVTTPGIVLKVSANTLKFGPGVSWKIGVP